MEEAAAFELVPLAGVERLRGGSCDPLLAADARRAERGLDEAWVPDFG